MPGQLWRLQQLSLACFLPRALNDPICENRDTGKAHGMRTGHAPTHHPMSTQLLHLPDTCLQLILASCSHPSMHSCRSTCHALRTAVDVCMDTIKVRALQLTCTDYASLTRLLQRTPHVQTVRVIGNGMVLQAPILQRFLQEFLSIGHAIQQLQFEGVQPVWDEASMQVLAAVAPTLRDVSVSAPNDPHSMSQQASGRMLQAMPTGLASLHLSWARPLESLLSLTMLTALTQLKLVLEPPAQTTQVSSTLPALVASLPALESLTVFDINGCLPEAFTASLPPTLRSLSLQPIRPITLQLQHLTRLDTMAVFELNKGVLHALAGLPSLTRLHVYGQFDVGHYITIPQPAVSPAFPALHTLRLKHLTHQSVYNGDLRKLSEFLPPLQALEVNTSTPFNGVVKSAACLEVGNFTSLTSLSLVLPHAAFYGSASLGEVVQKICKSLVLLQVLLLRVLEPEDASWEYAPCGNTQLIDERAFQGLAAMPALHTLQLIRCCLLKREHVREAIPAGSRLRHVQVDDARFV